MELRSRGHAGAPTLGTAVAAGGAISVGGVMRAGNKFASNTGLSDIGPDSDGVSLDSDAV